MKDQFQRGRLNSISVSAAVLCILLLSINMSFQRGDSDIPPSDDELNTSSVLLSTSGSEADTISPPTSPLPKRRRVHDLVLHSDSFEQDGSFHSEEEAPPNNMLNISLDSQMQDIAADPDEFLSQDDEDSSGEDSSVPTDDEIAYPQYCADDSSNDELSDSDASSTQSIDFPERRALLYPGCVKSTDEAVLQLLNLSITHKWTKSSLADVLQFYVSSLPELSNMPHTVYKLFNYVEALAPPLKEVAHFYCSSCLVAKEGESAVCVQCKEVRTGKFFELSVAAQLKHFFEHCNLAQAIDEQAAKQRDDGMIRDIQDGADFLKIKSQNSGRYDVTLLWSTDGVQLSKSSQVHMWPVQAVICEISPYIRGQFAFVCSLWIGDCKPDMQMYLKPFVETMIDLAETGVQWTHPVSKEKIVSKVLAPILSADAPAKADTLNAQYFSAKFGCNVCEQKAEATDSFHDRIVRRFLFKADPAPLRTGRRMYRQAICAQATGKPCKGVKGDSVVRNIPYFDMGRSCPVDYMHCVLLGVVLRLVGLWFFTRGPWYIGDRLSEIDEFLNKIKVPDFVSRLPRKLKHYKMWKASEWRSWLLYYSLPILRFAKLPERYINHYISLVGAVYTLLKSQISQSEINEAEKKLRSFVQKFGSLYHKSHLVYNVHNLLHLAECVRRWGPLHSTSAFPFENFSGVLSHMVHGTKHQGQELVNKLKLAIGLRVLNSKLSIQHRGEVSKIVLSASRAFECLAEEESGFLNRSIIGAFTVHDRVKYANKIFTSQFYEEGFKRANSYVAFTDVPGGALSFGRIVCFVDSDNGNNVLCLIRRFKVDHLSVLYNPEGEKIDHIIPVSDSKGNLGLLSLRSIEDKLIKVENYLCRRPNDVEVNL